MKTFIVAAAMLLCYTHAFSRQLDPYFDQVAGLKQLNGNILLAKNNKTVYKRSFGYADFASGRLNNADSQYNLASISKIFTSTAILQLKEKGLLKLDDHFIKYFPAFPYPDITIRHLLTHTSGLPDLELFEDLIRKYPDTIISNNTILRELERQNRPLYAKPGDKFEYCNNGFSLLAMLVEKISNSSFAAYLQKKIFIPANMQHTSVGYKKDSNSVQFFTIPVFYDSSFVNIDLIGHHRYTHYNCSGGTGQSNIITTTADLLAFDQAFFSGRLLNAASIAEAFTPVKLNNGQVYEGHMDTMGGEGKGYYGLGWEIFDQPGYGRSVGHGGYKIGMATFYFRNLERKQTIIAFDNTAGSEFGRIITSSYLLMNNQAPPALRIKRSLVRIYGQAIADKGTEYGFSLFSELKADTVHYYLNEWEMNNLGGTLLYAAKFAGHQLLALEVFKLNTLLFPESFNTYDSYADALYENGKKDEAIRMYRHSIVLNPNNFEGKDKLKKLLENR